MALVLDYDDKGDLTLQWLSNSNYVVKGPYKEGWSPPKVTKNYYDYNKRCATYIPYTTTTDKFRMNQRNVLMHGIELTEAQMLPAPVLRAIEKHPYVWWDPPKQTTAAYSAKWRTGRSTGDTDNTQKKKNQRYEEIDD